ncbi:MAG: 30S ribosome-binding factor RbfA [Candidatus Poribacteria bacterium]|nr:30S ribosome-binding factor RbfA [Candidatus Poribacteria bacterium]
MTMLHEAPYTRAERVAEQLKRELGDVLQREVKDPRLRQCVVANVRLSGDLRVAWVGLSVYPAEEKPGVERALNKASGFIRRQVTRRMKLRNSPELRFEFDDGAKRLIDMTQLIDQVDKGEPDSAPDEDDDN